jgi:hypothetical protein
MNTIPSAPKNDVADHDLTPMLSAIVEDISCKASRQEDMFEM